MVLVRWKVTHLDDNWMEIKDEKSILKIVSKCCPVRNSRRVLYLFHLFCAVLNYIINLNFNLKTFMTFVSNIKHIHYGVIFHSTNLMWAENIPPHCTNSKYKEKNVAYKRNIVIYWDLITEGDVWWQTQEVLQKCSLKGWCKGYKLCLIQTKIKNLLKQGQ